jgi:N-acetylglucosaminyldiphosphoundecaprenol N-acetyl-beta-D-mannosaminyltransferase
MRAVESPPGAVSAPELDHDRGPGLGPIDPLRFESLLGVEFASVTESELIEWALGRLARGQGTWICPVNIDVLRQIARDPGIRRLVGGADALVADGMPLVWASRIQGTPLPERVTGSSLINTLTGRAALEGRSIFLLGGNDGTAQAAGARLCEESPGLRLAGWHCPPFGFERSAREREVIFELVCETKPEIVFAGLGFPKQDRLITELRKLLPNACFVSCGISFSMVAGEVPRAPAWVQKAGFEWAYRMGQEPRRLAGRYLLHGLPFAARLGAASVRRRLTGAAGRAGDDGG